MEFFVFLVEQSLSGQFVCLYAALILSGPHPCRNSLAVGIIGAPLMRGVTFSWVSS